MAFSCLCSHVFSLWKWWWNSIAMLTSQMFGTCQVASCSISAAPELSKSGKSSRMSIELDLPSTSIYPFTKSRFIEGKQHFANWNITILRAKVISSSTINSYQISSQMTIFVNQFLWGNGHRKKAAKPFLAPCGQLPSAVPQPGWRPLAPKSNVFVFNEPSVELHFFDMVLATHDIS